MVGHYAAAARNPEFQETEIVTSGFGILPETGDEHFLNLRAKKHHLIIHVPPVTVNYLRRVPR